MKAARFTAPGTPLEITSIPQPRPGPGQALVRVRAVGLCGSDVHITAGHTPTAFTPITLGHEIAGVVEAVGDRAGHHVSAGDHVFVNPMVGCLVCRFCRAGEVNFCPRRRILGIQLDGALAEYVLAPVANLTVMPKYVGFPETALIESAGTANHAVRALRAAPGDVVAVIGAGGLGMQAVHLAVARGAQVVAVDTDPVARQRCLDAGALATIDPASPDTVEQVLDAARRPDGLDGVVDCVGIGITFTTALRMLRVNGHCAVVGIGGEPLALTAPAHFMRRALRVSGIYGYTAADISEVAAKLADGSLDLRASISAVVPLDEVNEGIRMFADRHNSPVRVVVEP
ncbi:alcohol dehydrogenase catalytic domain-containing protein [Streptomyces sp. BBFR51]|uniref:alcohol dehydrogenase catalytic domain-containing protein n=1 Tax=Streptomyces sp. BBFR51 TaxID=3372856 RepID=UPI0037DDA193